MKNRNWAAVASALIASAAIGACGAQAAGARQGGAPSKATIEQLVESYTGGESPTRRFQFSDIQVAAPRVLKDYEVYGLKGGTKVWLARATYTVFTSAGDVGSPDSTCERKEAVEYYYIYKDEFGKWAEYATSHPGTSDRGVYHGGCPDMPGVAIFSTPMPTGQG